MLWPGYSRYFLGCSSCNLSVVCDPATTEFRLHLLRFGAPVAMAGPGHGAHNITHGGLSLHATRGWHSRVGQGMCAVMWFWVLYRAKQDGAVLMGWRHPWDGHGHSGHDDRGNGHEEGKIQVGVDSSS